MGEGSGIVTAATQVTAVAWGMGSIPGPGTSTWPKRQNKTKKSGRKCVSTLFSVYIPHSSVIRHPFYWANPMSLNKNLANFLEYNCLYRPQLSGKVERTNGKS